MFLSYSGITPWFSSCHCSLLQGIGSYFFVNIENMEENGNMLIIRELWIYWLIALK